MRTDAGDKIVDWLIDLSFNKALPRQVRDDAREKLRACALRQPGQTVQDVIGARN